MVDLKDPALKIIGKTIAKTSWIGGSWERGNANLRIDFTDGSTVTIEYSCYGGVGFADEGDNQ